jgi:hypothetical protein
MDRKKQGRQALHRAWHAAEVVGIGRVIGVAVERES